LPDHWGVEFSTRRTQVKKSRFTEEKIISIIREADAGGNNGLVHMLPLIMDSGYNFIQ
jgi:hypothetical protein